MRDLRRTDRLPKGRRIFLACAVPGGLALAIAAFAARDRIAEAWWMRRLRSPDDSTRIQAAGRLADRKCLRAAPIILELIAGDIREEAQESTDRSGTDEVRLTPLLHAFHRLGPAASPSLEPFGEPPATDDPREIVRFRRLVRIKWYLEDSWRARARVTPIPFPERGADLSTPRM